MQFISSVLVSTFSKVAVSFLDNWPYLVASIVLAVLLKRFIDSDKVGRFLMRHRRAGIWGATAVAVTTPLCSCGTTAVILGMMASMVPWAPIVAFMVASPLTSPQELVYSAGLFGWPFALTFFGASVVLGITGGLVAMVLESRGVLANQVRFAGATTSVSVSQSATASISRGSAPSASAGTCCGGTSGRAQPVQARPVQAQPGPLDEALLGDVRGDPRAVSRTAELLRDFVVTGRRLFGLFLLFAFVGYFLNGLVPQAWISSLFGAGKTYSVPLAATLGLPFYLNTEASLPLVRSMMDAGMSHGAALAFIITGAGTSIGAIAGALTIARWRVVGLVVATLWAGAVLFGLGYDLLAIAA